MKIELEHTNPETAASEPTWTAYITDKDSYTISRLTEVQYNAFMYLKSQNKDLAGSLKAIAGLTSDEQSPLMRALHTIAHKTLKTK